MWTQGVWLVRHRIKSGSLNSTVSSGGRISSKIFVFVQLNHHTISRPYPGLRGMEEHLSGRLSVCRLLSLAGVGDGVRYLRDNGRPTFLSTVRNTDRGVRISSWI